MSPRGTILVCDDEELIRWSLAEHLREEGYDVVEAANGEAGVAAVAEHAPKAMFLDLKMPEMDGLTALRKIRESGSDVPVVVLTAHGGVDSAIAATRLGAAAYLAKPFDLREITLTLDKVLSDDRLRQELHYLRSRAQQGYGEFIGRADNLRPLFDDLERLESVAAPTVLLLGESGTGKDVLARAIHARGPRRDKMFLEIDCASLPEPLIESELFGHERGSFTDARATKRGLFEVASGGVVFLDEIGEISLGTQAKLLRALENRMFKRVGGVANLRMDCGIIAATNRDLREEVKKGTFREDLYFRLNVIPLRIPPLRDRRSDIPLLVTHFLEHYERTLGRKIVDVAGEALSLLERYTWPGNVRELRNVVERMVLLARDRRITAESLPPEIRFAGVIPSRQDGCPFVLPVAGVDLEAVERGLLAQALERTQNNQSAAARLLGISRFALRYRMSKFGL